MLELKNLSLSVGGEPYIADVNLRLLPNKMNVLLGATLSGKTTLMRLIAGLEKPDSGAIHLNGEEISAQPVQKRNVAMVYQQFVNYPTMTVFDNIASPLVAAKKSRAEIKRQVEETAQLLGLMPFLNRRPAQLSGGQQQRTALARALVKEASIVLLDEPLVNLDYKLREELREELPRLFAARSSVVIYATADPAEALMLGGHTAALHQGRVVQAGVTANLYHNPDTLTVAVIFSDPPLNIAAAVKKDGQMLLQEGGDELALPAPAQLADGDYYIAFRAHHIKDEPPRAAAIRLDGRVQIAEIAGSESFVHLRVGAHDWVMQTPNIVSREVGSRLHCYIRPQDMMIFDKDKRRVSGDSAHGNT